MNMMIIPIRTTLTILLAVTILNILTTIIPFATSFVIPSQPRHQQRRLLQTADITKSQLQQQQRPQSQQWLLPPLPSFHHRIFSSLSLSSSPSSPDNNEGRRKTTTTTPATSPDEGQTPAKDVFFAGEFDERDVISRQKYVSTSLENDDNVTDYESYTKLQRETFDEMSSWFASEEGATPARLAPVMKYLTGRFLRDIWEAREREREQRKRGPDDEDDAAVVPDATLKILDVGCGTGVLFPHLLAAAENGGWELDLVGCDLSPKMVERARETARGLMEKGDKHEIDVVDACDYTTMRLEEGEEGYDGVIINACFGNFYDLDEVIKTTSRLLKPTNGIFSVTHPLGSSFVQNLHSESPTTVRHPLPPLPEFRDLLRYTTLSMVDFAEEKDLIVATDDGNIVENFPLYYASARTVPYRALPQIMHLRGVVADGYGRGGKTLGVPTANLSEETFAAALESVDAGVYFGWAVVEDAGNKTKVGRNVFHKAVANVGYSPTFVGEENKRKIVEAHLILDDPSDISDFYNETMRLALSGYLRPERKFPSFPELIAQIRLDIDRAREALTTIQPFAGLRTDSFLVDPCRRVNRTAAEGWVGKGGGDVNASWEFVDQEEVLGTIPLGRFL